MQQRAGLNIRWLERDEMRDLVPALNPEGLRGGTYSPEDGSASPMLTAHAFYRRAVEQGAQFRFQERVTGLMRRRGMVVGVRTDKGGYATETRHQRRRAVGQGRGRHGRARRAGRARQPRGRHHRAGGAVHDAHGRRHPAGGRVDQLLLLPAQARRRRVLHHARPADRRNGPARDVDLPADDRAPHGRADAEAGEHQGAPHVAGALPDDARRVADHRSRARARGLHPRRRDVRAGLHARPGRRQAAHAHADRPGNRRRRRHAQGAVALPRVRRRRKR